MFVKDFVDEYGRYRLTAEKAMAQVPDEGLNRIVATDGNSIGMLVHHVSGNFVSRFTDFLTTDGEKPGRDRDREFADATFTRAELAAMWAEGWGVLEGALAVLTDDDLARTVTIRSQPLTVHEALCRSLAHAAMHVGQIVLLSRMLASGDWKWITIPKGQSVQYNENPTLDKSPAR